MPIIIVLIIIVGLIFFKYTVYVLAIAVWIVAIVGAIAVIHWITCPIRKAMIIRKVRTETEKAERDAARAKKAKEAADSVAAHAETPALAYAVGIASIEASEAASRARGTAEFIVEFGEAKAEDAADAAKAAKEAQKAADAAEKALKIAAEKAPVFKAKAPAIKKAREESEKAEKHAARARKAKKAAEKIVATDAETLSLATDSITAATKAAEVAEASAKGAVTRAEKKYDEDPKTIVTVNAEAQKAAAAAEGAKKAADASEDALKIIEAKAEEIKKAKKEAEEARRREAEKALAAAASQGDEKAQYDFSRLLHGKGDVTQYVHWLTQAAKNGYAPAEHEIVKLCLEDSGEASKKTLAALESFEKFAKQGDIKSTACLARISSSINNSKREKEENLKRLMEANEKTRQKERNKPLLSSFSSITTRFEPVGEPVKIVKKTCNACGGTGKEDCYSCHGTGNWGKCVFCKGFGFHDFGAGSVCRDCGGSGLQRCDRCHGFGKQTCNFCNGHGKR